MSRVAVRSLVSLLIVGSAVWLLSGAVTEAGDRTFALPSPEYAGGFWRHWGDSRAELAAYDLTMPRYGELRRGTAVSIVVSERFRSDQRVKSERGGDDTYPVLKLNFVRDFPTGIYDYNLMTSAFVALEPVHGLPPGAPTKISFSAQEWCGHAYQQAVFDSGGVKHELHSYFENEADQSTHLERPDRGTAAVSSEDTLWLWARGLSYPYVAPGQSATLPILASLESSRLRHRTLGWHEAELLRSSEATSLAVPAGRFEVDRATARLRLSNGAERVWTYWVETAFPHRMVAWESSDGERGELIGSDRLAYWQMNGEAFHSAVEALGLAPRSARAM